MAQAQQSHSPSSRQESIALSDLMAVLSDVSEETRHDQPVASAGPAAQHHQLPYPGPTPPPATQPVNTAPDNLIPLRRPSTPASAKPHLVAVPNPAPPPISQPNLAIPTHAMPEVATPDAPVPALPAIASPASPSLVPTAPTPGPQLSAPQRPALQPSSSPSSPHLAQPSKTLAELTQDLWDLRMVMLSDSDLYGQQINHLQQRLWLLAGLATGGLVLLGIVLGWFMVNLRDAQMRLANYNDAIATNSLRLEELDSTTVSALSAKVESLNEQVPQNLTDELEAANKDIEALKAQINELETSVNAQDQALSVLVGAMQGLVGR